MMIGGSALRAAADEIIERGKRFAAHFMEADAADIAFADGQFTIAGTDIHVIIPSVLTGGVALPFTYRITIEKGTWGRGHKTGACSKLRRSAVLGGNVPSSTSEEPDPGTIEVTAAVHFKQRGSEIKLV